jgi:two-component system chemotaxis sensor kinase CheA
MTTSSMEKSSTTSVESLGRELLQLSQRAVGSNLSVDTDILELALAFEKWTLPASTVFGVWIESFRLESHRIVEELKSGRSSAKAMESLLRALLQVHRAIEKEREKNQPAPKPAFEPPAAAIPAPPAAVAPVVEPPNEEKEIQAEYLKSLHQGLEFKIGQMDDLFELLGEMSLAQAEFMEAARPYLAASPTLSLDFSRLDQKSKSIREKVLALRAIPVEPLFQKVARQAKASSRQSGKALEVSFEGGEVELDQGLLEELEGLLQSLLENSLQHGIETPDERREKGKPPIAVFSLKASHLGGAFILEVSDDGRGLDFAALQSRAQALGWMGTGENLTAAQLSDFLFRPGFMEDGAEGFVQMAERVQKLKGSLRLQSVRGEGLKVILRLPKTLAQVEGVLIRVGRQRYLMPMTQVRKISLSDTQEYVTGRDGRKLLKTPDGAWPLIDLNEWFKEPATSQNRVALQVEAGRSRLCLLADEVMGKQQVLLKGLENASRPGVGGGAILSDGKVGFILDVQALMELPAGPSGA